MPSEARRVEVHGRGEDGTRVLSEHEAGESPGLAPVGVELAVDEVFADLPEEPEAVS